MYNMHYETGAGLKPEFIDGVRNFIEHTMTLDIFKNNGLVRCPCSAFDVELETTLQHPQHILEEVSDDKILNVEEEISENEENESFDDEEWDDNENETTEEEEWENDGIETSLGGIPHKQAAKKKSRRPIDPEDIAGSISSALERISHDTHLFAVPFGKTNPRQYYPNYCRPVGASATSQPLPSRRYEDLPL
ncbi:hypothetical protein H5410_003622 [Solanum commersonii]|uniref:Transposase-associated domain-containing protein n=1 Tax=Solanum commersonii TaxID=4109 RepID=A0A9J6B5E8_SOLCO|nr:hypothetical protein H5410_003622 [Solanum commersonii]